MSNLCKFLTDEPEPDTPSKKCTSCGKILPIDDFAIATKDGYRRGKCKPCQTEHFQKSKGTWEEYKKEKSHREELHLLQKEGKRRCRMCEEIKDLDEFHYSSSPKLFYNRKTCCKKCAYETWRIPAAKTERFKKMKAAWDKKSHNKHRVSRNASVMKRYHSHPQTKLKVNLRTRLGQMIRKSGTVKTESALELLGADIEFVRTYLKNQFQEGMTWENWSRTGWHIDHIIPLDSFDMTNIEDRKKAFHYTNLQPLWAKDNLLKSNKMM